MKTIKFTILALIIVVCTSTSFSEYLTPELLRCPQWKSSWCWAGAAQACLSYYGFDHDSLSNEDCAHVITTNNDPQPMRVITTIINNFLPGYAYDPANNLNSEEDFKEQADSCAPFACFWPSHFVTYAGYEGDKHLIMNPWPYGTDSSTAGAWEENCTYNYIADKSSSYVRTKGMPRTPFVTVRTPNGGEEWEQGTTKNITWADNIDGNVKIELFKGGSLKEALAASTESDGSFEWQIAGDYETGIDYKVKITSIDSTALNDESDDNFSITVECIIVCPYFQNFDTLETNQTILPKGWEQLKDDLDWIVWTGKTPSKEPDQGAATGPDGDHTTTAANYIYVESSSPNNPDKTADFATAKFDFKSLTDPELTFWYHMFSDNSGADEMGDLYLDINVDGTWHNDVIHLTGDHGDEWFSETVDLSSYMGERVVFQFRAITGSGWASDICIDDFEIDGVSGISDFNKNLFTTPDLKFFGSRIYFQVPEGAAKNPVRISLYNSQGKLVRMVVNENFEPGNYSVGIDKTDNNGQRLATGLYLCRLETKGFNKTINVLVSK